MNNSDHDADTTDTEESEPTATKIGAGKKKAAALVQETVEDEEEEVQEETKIDDDDEEEEEEADSTVLAAKARKIELDRIRNLSEEQVVAEILECEGEGKQSGVEMCMDKHGKGKWISPYRVVYLQFLRTLATVHLSVKKGVVVAQPIEFGLLCSAFKVSTLHSISRSISLSSL